MCLILSIASVAIIASGVLIGDSRKMEYQLYGWKSILLILKWNHLKFVD